MEELGVRLGSRTVHRLTHRTGQSHSYSMSSFLEFKTGETGLCLLRTASYMVKPLREVGDDLHRIRVSIHLWGTRVPATEANTGYVPLLKGVSHPGAFFSLNLLFILSIHSIDTSYYAPFKLEGKVLKIFKEDRTWPIWRCGSSLPMQTQQLSLLEERL